MVRILVTVHFLTYFNVCILTHVFWRNANNQIYTWCIGFNFLLIASGTIRSSARATPPKLKPHPVTPLILHLDYAEFTQTLINTEKD